MPNEDRPAQRPSPQGKPDGHEEKGWKPPKAPDRPRPIKPPSGSGGTAKGK